LDAIRNLAIRIIARMHAHMGDPVETSLIKSDHHKGHEGHKGKAK
jgi:hypothetical protein